MVICLIEHFGGVLEKGFLSAGSCGVVGWGFVWVGGIFSPLVVPCFRLVAVGSCSWVIFARLLRADIV